MSVEVIKITPLRIKRSRAKGSRLWAPNALPIVCVTRGTKWGNPFRVRPPGMQAAYYSVLTRDEAVKEFRRELRGIRKGGWMLTDPVRGYEICMDDIRRELWGRNLACWCGLDEACHADVYFEALYEW